MDEEGKNLPRSSSNISTILVGIGVGLVLVVVTFTLLNYFKILPFSAFFPQNSLTQTTASQGQKQQYPEQTTIQIPISPSDPAVEFTKVNYNLSGTIYSIKDQGDGRWELVFRGSGGNIYFDMPFIITSKTAFNNVTGGIIGPSDLKVDDRISLLYQYDPIKKEGVVSTVIFRGHK